MPLEYVSVGPRLIDGAIINELIDQAYNAGKGVFNVLNYGAKGDGATDDSEALQAALNAANANGGGAVLLPAGVYRKSKNTDTLVMYSNTTLMGYGDSSVIFHDDVSTLPRKDLLTASNTSSVAFRNFKIVGTASNTTLETNQSQSLIGSYIDNLLIEGVTFESLRFMATAFSYVNNVRAVNNTLKYILRDGLRFSNSYNVSILGNKFQSVSDDAVALHSLDNTTAPVGSCSIIQGNTFDACQGIKSLGAKSLIIQGNTFTRMLRGPINVQIPYSGTEGNSPVFDINISDNVIQDTFSGFGSNYNILVGSYAYEDDGLAPSQPGVNAAPYSYNWLANIDSSGVNVGSSNITISNNTIKRTLPTVSAYSDYGYGQLYDREYGWPYNPAITSSNYQEHGVMVYGAVQGLSIKDNKIEGMGTAFSGIVLTSAASSTYPDFNNVLIEGNIIRDCPGAGISIPNGDATAGRNLIIRGNILDLDPFFRASNHDVDNTWSSTGSVVGILTGASIEGQIITDNKFSHCDTPISPSMANIAYVNNNFVVCEPTSISNNAANKGVRNLSLQYNFIYIKYDGDPTSGAFTRIDNMPLTTSASIPATGWYAQGHFVKQSGAAPGTTGYTIGWLRLTTGTGHVSGTDWAAVAIPAFSQSSNILSLLRSSAATSPMVVLEQSSSGDCSQEYLLTGTQSWVIGIDNSDSDKFKLGAGNNGFVNPVFQATTTESFIAGKGGLATDAVNGFLYIPNCAGTPTGVPTSITGYTPIVYDTTGDKIYIYNGAWKATAALT